MNQKTNDEAFDKWFKKEFGEAYYPTEAIKLAWQAAIQQPLKRLSDEDVDSYILNKGHLDCVLDFSAEHDDVTELKTELRRLVKAIMDEMERINHE